MERGSNKHSGQLDDDMARQARDHTQGGAASSRVEAWRDPEPAGDDQPEPTMIPGGSRPGGAPSPLTADDLEARSEFGRWIPRSVLPAEREELIEAAADAGAPADVLSQLAQLPADQAFVTISEMWEALGHPNEDFR